MLSIFGGTILTGGLTGSIYAIALPFLGLSPVPVYLQPLVCQILVKWTYCPPLLSFAFILRPV